MFDNVFNFILTTFILIMSGASAGRFVTLAGIEIVSFKGFCFILVWFGVTLFIISFGLYLVRRNKK